MSRDLRHGLVAEYLFAGNADDSSGCARHGIVHGATPTSDRFGRANHAYSFDGVDDYIEVSPPPQFSSLAMSVSAWVRYHPRNFNGWTNCIVAQDDGNDDDQSRRLFQLSTSDGHIVWHRMIGARDPMCRRRVRPEVWQHVVAVHDAGVNRLYVDGVMHDSVEHRLWTHVTQPLHIGRKGTAESFFFFSGAIDDVRIYDRALTDVEVAALFNEAGWSTQAGSVPDPTRDPLSGRWGQSGVVFLDLVYDGERRVSGRIMHGRPSNMAAVEKGTFDRESGALRLEGHARDDRIAGPVAYSIEGMLDGGEICVLARINVYSGNHILTRNGAQLRLTNRSLRSHLGAIAWRAKRLVQRD